MKAMPFDYRRTTTSSDFDRLQSEENKIFEGFGSSQLVKPTYGLREFESHYLVNFDCPGAKPEQIEANGKHGVLRIAIPKIAVPKGKQIKIGEGNTGFFEKLSGQKKPTGTEKVA